MKNNKEGTILIKREGTHLYEHQLSGLYLNERGWAKSEAMFRIFYPGLAKQMEEERNGYLREGKITEVEYNYLRRWRRYYPEFL